MTGQLSPLAQGKAAGVAAPYGSLLLKTGQTTQYNSAADDGSLEKGVAKSYTVNTAGAQSGTSNVTMIHLQAASVAFASATKTITRSNYCNGFVPGGGETIVVSGTKSNNGTFTTVSATANTIVVNEALTDESADAGQTTVIKKTEAISNNTVLDNNTGLTWTRYNPVVLGLIGKMRFKSVINYIFTIFNYAIAANAASLGGYTDWRVPNLFEMMSLMDYEAVNAVPDTTAFPSVVASSYHTSTTQPSAVANSLLVRFDTGVILVRSTDGTDNDYILLVRGG